MRQIDRPFRGKEKVRHRGGEGDQPSRDETDYSAFMGEIEEWIDRIIDGAEVGVSYEAQHITFTKTFHATLPRASLTY